MPEIEVDDVWSQLDDFGLPLTGEGLLIADLDSGVDWTHPDLWYADGAYYDWLDDGDSIVENQTDSIDLDDSGTATSDEELRYIDNDANGVFDARRDWLWADSIIQDGIPQVGEPFFVVNETTVDGQLDLSEQLIMLNTPKTQYIVEKAGGNITVWQQGANLTSSTHEDTNGHGTAVAGVLLGGQLGHRDFVGAAPGAELMMIKVLGDTAVDALTIDEGLLWAYNHGADVILIEIGSWTYHYLDGSSHVEMNQIDFYVTQGIPVIAPSGNLGGKDKHAMFSTLSDTPYYVNFTIPPVTTFPNPPPEGNYIGKDIQEVYITVLSRDPIDFWTVNFSIVLQGVGTFYPLPGPMQNVFGPATIIGGVSVQSFIDVSPRGTSMYGIWIHDSENPLPQTPGSPWHNLNITTTSETMFHAYISDIESSWTGGSIWKSDVTNDHEITWPSTADLALSVASYRTRDLVFSNWNGPDTLYDIAGFSSIGPRIDGVPKQGIAAPGGYDIISDWTNASAWSGWYNAFGVLTIQPRFGGYRLFSGTSASGPHVAGAAAILLQYNPLLGDQMNTILTSTARNDTFTGTVPNDIWGFGKMNVSAAYESILPDTSGPQIEPPVYFPSTPQETMDTWINVTVTDESGVDTVILSWSNTTSWYNSTMLFDVDHYSYYIPTHPAGTNITFMFYANDSLDNWATSSEYNFTVHTLITTTTTTPTTPTTSGT
ncbi:MAG: S8 family serine peptidase, partial [Candidatus Thorarchaeota archaeon]